MDGGIDGGIEKKRDKFGSRTAIHYFNIVAFNVPCFMLMDTGTAKRQNGNYIIGKLHTYVYSAISVDRSSCILHRTT